MKTTSDLPHAALAEVLAHKATGAHPISVRRFTTGSHHDVFETTICCYARPLE